VVLVALVALVALFSLDGRQLYTFGLLLYALFVEVAIHSRVEYTVFLGLIHLFCVDFDGVDVCSECE